MEHDNNKIMQINLILFGVKKIPSKSLNRKINLFNKIIVGIDKNKQIKFTRRFYIKSTSCFINF